MSTCILAGRPRARPRGAAVADRVVQEVVIVSGDEPAGTHCSRAGVVGDGSFAQFRRNTN